MCWLQLLLNGRTVHCNHVLAAVAIEWKNGFIVTMCWLQLLLNGRTVSL